MIQTSTPSSAPVTYELLPSSAPTSIRIRTIVPPSAPLSCSQPTLILQPWECKRCCRSFKKEKGLKQHENKCKQQISGNEILPAPVVTIDETLVWGLHTMSDIELVINATYDEIVHWRRNVFMLPSGAAGKAFVQENTRLLELWTMIRT